MSLSDLTDMMASYIRPSSPTPESQLNVFSPVSGGEQKYVYLLAYSNLEDYKMRDRPYTHRVWSDLKEVIKAAKEEVEFWKEEREEEGWTFLSEEEIEKSIRKLNCGFFDYMAYSKDCIMAVWISKCRLD